MAHYVIGDIQGCHQALVQLLEQIGFSPSRDKVWFAGDLVNRGPDSLASVRFIYQLGSAADSVLGNHDFHLLAACNGLAKAKPLDKIDRFLNASDGQQLLQWLRHRPMLLESPAHRTVVTHAGIPPCWDLQQTRALAREVETALQSDNYLSLLARLYGNKPDQWNPELQGNASLCAAFADIRESRRDSAVRSRLVGPGLPRARLASLLSRYQGRLAGAGDSPRSFAGKSSAPDMHLRCTYLLSRGGGRVVY